MEKLLPASVFMFSAAFLLPRVIPGIPMGVDSASHLYKVLFIHRSFKSYGYVPFWTPDWYGGTPILFLYPPLGYFTCFIISLSGLDPISAYKVVEAGFYLIAPYTIFRLGNELGFSSVEGWLASLIFSLSPAVVENLLFYDRFPNILSIPILCLYLVYFYRSFKKGFELRSAVISALLLASLILIHHLSALIAVLISLIALLTSIFESKRFTSCLGALSFTLPASLGLSAIWTVPFINASRFISENPFYNRNVIDATFAKFTFFINNSVISGFGVIHLALALTMLVMLIQKPDRWGRYLFMSLICALMAGLALFELGIIINSPALKICSQSIVVAAFILMIAGLILNLKESKVLSYTFVSIWFLIFLWFGLGGFMVPLSGEMSPPFVAVPLTSYIWSRLDVHRFWLYLTLPASILAAPVTLKIVEKIKIRRFYKWIALTIIVVLVAGGSIKATWSLTHPINERLPQDYTPINQNIPTGIIRYLSADPWDGRILAIHCPFWIYLLPNYLDGKTLVDGWYPQGKILKPLYMINDYRLNDLEATSNNTERLRHWTNLIDSSDILGINWVMIGGSNESFKSSLVSGPGFDEVYSEPYGEGEITIYRSIVRHRLVDWTNNYKGNIDLRRETPDKINLELSDSFEEMNITVKEAYFPTWTAKSSGRQIEVCMDENNFISLRLPMGVRKVSVELYHSYDWRRPTGLSIGSLILMVMLYVYSGRHKKWA